jgi:hypothetical protein
MFPPGRAKPLTIPNATGSDIVPTIGMVVVAALKFETIRLCEDHVRLLADHLEGEVGVMRNLPLAGVPLND